MRRDNKQPDNQNVEAHQLEEQNTEAQRYQPDTDKDSQHMKIQPRKYYTANYMETAEQGHTHGLHQRMDQLEEKLDAVVVSILSEIETLNENLRGQHNQESEKVTITKPETSMYPVMQ